MAATLSVSDSLVEHGNEVVDTGAVNNDEILNEKPIGWIPTAVKHPRSGVK